MDQLGHVGHGHEDAAADQGDQHDGARHVLARVDGLLGEGGDGVEPEERVRCDGGPGRDGGDAGGVVEERLRAGQTAGARGGHHVADGQRHKEHDDQQLERHQHVVGLVRHLDAQDVQHGGDEDEAHDPHTDGDSGELSVPPSGGQALSLRTLGPDPFEGGILDLSRRTAPYGSDCFPNRLGALFNVGVCPAISVAVD